MNVHVLADLNDACKQFVRRQPDGRVCHLQAWAHAAASAAKLKSYYLVARDAGGIKGVLPLIHARSRLFGNFMVSQAFSDHGGILSDSPQARDALFDRAVEIATDKKCDSIEFRNVIPLPYDLHTRKGKMVMYLPLDSDPEKIWKAFNCKVRNQVRKAEKSGIVVSQGGTDQLTEFYSVYAKRMRQLGTPVFPSKLLKNLMDTLPENSRLFLARLNNQTIGGALTFCFNGYAEIPFASTLVEYNRLCPNNLLYWSIIKHYCLQDANFFDFGRCSVDGPTHRFKKQWGPEPVDLHYQYWTRPGYELSLLSPDNPKFRKKIELWKKLPLWATRIAGPIISRKLP